ncbi:MAG: DUF1553 domain-containing protein [Bryobacterales bacterium]|nr:DUF1553 domain-containing protein [Bryobacterales bacterium]
MSFMIQLSQLTSAGDHWWGRRFRLPAVGSTAFLQPDVALALVPAAPGLVSALGRSLLLLTAFHLSLAQEVPLPELSRKIVTAADCAFQVNPGEFLTRQSRLRQDVFSRTAKVSASLPRAAAAPLEVPRRNFIDNAIFDRLAAANIPSARLSTDEEFMRRVSLDLTGRLPAPAEIRAFLADNSSTRRDALIGRLLDSPEFTDRWTMWLGDLLQNVAFPSNFDRQYDGRNAFYKWIRANVAAKVPLRDIASMAVTATGNSYSEDFGSANYPLNAITPMGPVQDSFDTMLGKTASAFLGLSYYDCLLCHDGRGHLDQVSLWGSRTPRAEAQRMAAFFSRMRFPKRNVPANNPLYNSFDVGDQPTGAYDLNTTYGNRPDRKPVGTSTSLTPEYRPLTPDGTRQLPPNGNWREAFAQFMVRDPLFAVNFANRIWKEFFGLALADPVDGLDPWRLDPANPPAAPWTLQATHPELLRDLAILMAGSDYNLREFIRWIVESSAYQLSSRYEGDWKYDYLTLFARHYPRRLEGEEVHDAVVKASGVPAAYNMTRLDPVPWAMQLSEPAEPRSNGAVATFINAFFRGNRDTFPRSQNGSILQQMSLMNDTFVLNRIRLTASPTLQAAAKLEDNSAVIDELFLLFLSRMPSETERARALVPLAATKTPAERNAAIEDLAWVCVNKVDFLFSY